MAAAKAWRRALIILLAVLLLAGAAVGGWLLYVRHIKQKWVEPLISNPAFRVEYDSFTDCRYANAGQFYANAPNFTFYKENIANAQCLLETDSEYINIIYRCNFRGEGELEVLLADLVPSDIPGQRNEEANHFEIKTNAELEYISGIGAPPLSDEFYSDDEVRAAFERFKPDIAAQLKVFFSFFGRENLAL